MWRILVVGHAGGFRYRLTITATDFITITVIAPLENILKIIRGINTAEFTNLGRIKIQVGIGYVDSIAV